MTMAARPTGHRAVRGEPGATFTTRRDAVARRASTGRPSRASAGQAAGGAESVVLAGGYVDDEDYGDVVLYTGAGGRDVATGARRATRR